MKLAAPFLVLFLLSACASQDSEYTLYRNSPLDPYMRVHIATFDAADGREYNSVNCELARDLFQSQPGVSSRFWCELGRFRR